MSTVMTAIEKCFCGSSCLWLDFASNENINKASYNMFYGKHGYIISSKTAIQHIPEIFRSITT